MRIIQKRNSGGFTFAEMIVTVAILGTLVSIAAPKFTELTLTSKIRRSETTIINIQQAYFTHYLNSSFSGKAEFPPSPADSLMTLEWSILPSLINGRTPASLSRKGKMKSINSSSSWMYLDSESEPKETTIDFRTFAKG